MIRHILPSLALAAGTCIVLSSAAESLAQEPETIGHQKADPLQRAKGEKTCDQEGCCDQCGGNKGGKGGAKGAANFNCNCNGSYKFPVPPLSTYHWPGMYSHQLMTDYHSPWRFLPLRPYTEEPPFNGASSRRASHRLRSISFDQPVRAPRRGVEPMSAKIKRLYGTR